MVYISEGNLLNNKSPWRMSIVPEFFWGVINFIVLFFTTLIPPVGGTTSQHGSGPRPDAPGYPRRRMGGINTRGGGPPPPPMGGGG